ncbi:response regulator transcription factor [Roseofilum casamattae]|uniref:Response regulator transcription factor n=1 Tax=Roseofilum casamattae BLCC-M143 TaxID=3022442 RepID=A0ABT7C072_9CYAN|nr:response regulator transcription factor [Roseofilum casamattae]MDJ1184859.1 response regulator transcription factor [Roseofilum casamattae BLCC-M143]
MKILLVEDDRRIAEALAEALSDRHYTVDIADDGELGWSFIESTPYNLILLDVMLPKLNGIEFCHRLRQQGYTIPVLMLTARDTSSDKVMGLDVGADDYVVKPFDLPELMARVRALLRRNSDILPPTLEWAGLQLDPNTCKVEYTGKTLQLTPKEYSLLELFLRSNGRCLSRTAILDQVWCFEEQPGEETVKVHLRSLRQKLKAAGAPANYIETVYGLGYRLNQSL